MSTLKADALTTKSDNTDLTITGGGTGVPNLESGFKVGGTVEKLTGIAPSTSGNILTSDGTNWTSAAAAGGGSWNIIGTSVASNSANLTITGLDSTYDTYAVAFSDIVPASNSAIPWFRVGDSSGIDSGGADYKHALIELVDSSGSITVNGGGGDTFINLGTLGVGSTAGEGYGGMGYLVRPGDGSTFPMFSFRGAYMNNAARGVLITGNGHRAAVITLDRVLFQFGSGNITSGRMTVWGIAHA